MSQTAEDRNVKRRSAPGGGGPGGRMNLSGEKASDFRGTLRRLLNFLSPYKITLVIVVIMAIASSAFAILGPMLLGFVTSALFEGVLNQMAGAIDAFDFTFISHMLLLLLGLYLTSALFNYLQGYLMVGISQQAAKQLRSQVMAKINRLPLSYFDRVSQGDVLSRVTNDIDTITQTMRMIMSQMISSATTLLGILLMMFIISWQMSLLAILMIPMSLLITLIIVKRTQKYYKTQQAELAKVNGHVEEMLGAHQVVKAFGIEEESIERFSEHNEDLYHAAWRAQFLSGLMMPTLNVVSNFGYVAVTILGGSLVVAGSLTVGSIQAFIQYVRSFNHPIMNLANITNVMQQTAAAAERVFEFLDEENETEDINEPVSTERINGQVSFNNISFSYSEGVPIIKNFTASFPPGSKVAIVGPTGAGKTTIVKLLMRFYDVDSGSITLNGIDIKSFKRGELRSVFGMVLQDNWLFNGTIMDNLKYGDLDASEERVKQIARQANVDHFVRTLPDGYDMVINEETTNISEGQQQLMTIARAMLKNPKLLIFDEATSSVDTRTELKIQHAMDQLMAGRTTFIIAHRLSTIKHADVILVLNDGDIVEQGNHEELLEKDGFYASLYKSQFDVA